MDPERWRRLDDLFHAVVGLDADVRRAHLESVAGHDPSLVAEVEAMVAAHRASGGFLIEERLLSGLRPAGGLEPLAAGTVLGSFADLEKIHARQPIGVLLVSFNHHGRETSSGLKSFCRRHQIQLKQFSVCIEPVDLEAGR